MQFEAHNEVAVAAIIRQFDDPYSETSFGDQHKVIYDAGPLEIPHPRSGIIPRHQLEMADEQFREHAERILGKTRFDSCSLAFDADTTPVARGFVQRVGALHIDGSVADIDPQRTIRLVGIFHSALPTRVLLNPIRRSDFADGRFLQSVEGEPLDLNKVSLLSLPLGRISIFGANIPHTGQRALRRTRRIFLRWQLSAPCR